MNGSRISCGRFDRAGLNVPDRPHNGVNAPRSLLIFPCNGNAIEALDCLDGDWRLVAFVDDTAEKQAAPAHGHPVHSRSAIAAWPEAMVLAVPGSPASYRSRRGLIEGLHVEPHRWARLVHPAARVSALATIGRNVLIMAGTVITSNAAIGDHVCILANATIHHDVRIGRWSIVGSNVTIAGHVTVGENCYIGSGSTLMNGITVGDGAMVGIGSVVLRDVAPGSRVAGNPARELERKSA